MPAISLSTARAGRSCSARHDPPRCSRSRTARSSSPESRRKGGANGFLSVTDWRAVRRNDSTLRKRISTRVFAKPVPLHARRFWLLLRRADAVHAVMQGLSGLFLTLYYEPTPERAYTASSTSRTTCSTAGSSARSTRGRPADGGVHHRAHDRVYVTASYKHPRELNWVAGVVLFVVTMVFR